MPLPLAFPLAVAVSLFTGLAAASQASDWGDVVAVSSTMGVHDGRICVGEATRGDIGCPTYAPQVGTDGSISASSFIGDGSGLTGVVASTADRIVSGTTSLLAVSSTGFVSLTQAGTNTGWFDPARGLVTLGVSSTGAISGTTGYIANKLTVRGYIDLLSGTNVGVGLHALAENSGSYNVAVGPWAGQYGSQTSQNTLIGSWAGRYNTGANIAALGMMAAQYNTGNEITAVGPGAAQYNSSTGVTAIGNGAAEYSNYSTYLTAVGYLTARNNRAGFVTAVGKGAGSNNTGVGLAALGNQAAFYNTGSYVVAVGYNAAISNTGSDVVAIGRDSVKSNTFSNVVALGSDAQPDKANQIVLGNSSIVEVSTAGVIMASGVSTTGAVTATRFVGDGSGLTGVVASTADRIVSGTTSMVAVSNTGFVSLTQAGTNTGWFDPTRGLVTLGVSATGGISATTGYFSGKTGIGATSPAFQLTVVEPGKIPDASSVILYDNQKASTISVQGYGQAYFMARDINNNIEGIFGTSNNGTVFFGSMTNHRLELRTSNKARLAIGANGNVGISTTSPNAELDVAGTVSATYVKLADNDDKLCAPENNGTIRFFNGRISLCRAH